MARPLKSTRRDSRAQVLAAARAEFAARGFSGAGVDRIAARARVNKAMIYYHFGSKTALYREVVGDGIGRLIGDARAAIAGVPSAMDRFDAYVASLLRSAQANPHIVPILLREIAAGGRNIDADTLRLMSGLFLVVKGIVDEGRASGEFRPTDPLLTHFMIMGSVMFYAASAPIRAKMRSAGLLRHQARIPTSDASLVRHLGTVLRRTLSVDEEISSHA